ncbi:MAG: hypothetical protein ACXAC2_01890 [Candidatus Kariarchaeaceae archaeon]|jgi:hypothetical protein
MVEPIVYLIGLLALFNAIYVFYTYMIHSDQNRPRISFTIEMRQNQMWAVLKNVGNVTARDIKIELLEGCEVTFGREKKRLTDHSMFTRTSLIPSEGIEAFLDLTYSTLGSDEEPPELKYRVSYKDNGRRKWVDEFEINFAAFKDVGWLGEKTIHDVAESLDWIRRNISIAQLTQYQHEIGKQYRQEISKQTLPTKEDS